MGLNNPHPNPITLLEERRIVELYLEQQDVNALIFGNGTYRLVLPPPTDDPIVYEMAKRVEPCGTMIITMVSPSFSQVPDDDVPPWVKGYLTERVPVDRGTTEAAGHEVPAGSWRDRPPML